MKTSTKQGKTKQGKWFQVVFLGFDESIDVTNTVQLPFTREVSAESEVTKNYSLWIVSMEQPPESISKDLEKMPIQGKLKWKRVRCYK